MAKDHGDVVQRRAAAEEGRQRDPGAARRARDPSGQCARRRLLPRADAARAAPTLAERLKRARDTALRNGALGRRFRFPRLRAGLRVRRRCGIRTSIRSTRARSSRTAGSTSRARIRRAFRRGHVAALERAALASARRGAYFAGPMARYSLNFDELSPLAREAAREAGLGATCTQPVQEHHRPRGGSGLRLRRGAAHHRRLSSGRSTRISI